MARASVWPLLIAAAVTGSFSRSHATGGHAIDWRADLRYFARELPRRHGSPWHAISKADFEAAVADLDGRLAAMSSNTIALEFARLAALFGDGHTEMQLFDGPNAFSRLPVVVYRFGAELRVLAALPAYRELLGAEVLRAGAIDAATLLTRIEPYLAHDNECEYLHQAPTTLASPEVLNALGAARAVEAAELTFRLADGSVATRTLPATRTFDGMVSVLGASSVAPPWSASRREQPYWFAIRRDDRLAYFRLDQSNNHAAGPSIEAVARDFFAEVDAVAPARLVIDVRNNAGGNNARNAPIVRGIESRAPYRTRGALFVVTGRMTFSAGTELVRDLLQIARPVVVGECSRGDPRVFVNREEFRLPSSGYRVDYSQQWRMREPAASSHLPLDVPAPPTFARYAAGLDPAIEAILAYGR